MTKMETGLYHQISFSDGRIMSIIQTLQAEILRVTTMVLYNSLPWQVMALITPALPGGSCNFIHRIYRPLARGRQQKDTQSK